MKNLLVLRFAWLLFDTTSQSRMHFVHPRAVNTDLPWLKAVMGWCSPLRGSLRAALIAWSRFPRGCD